MFGRKGLGLIAAALFAMTAMPALADVHFSFGTSYGEGWHHHGYGHHDFYRPAYYPAPFYSGWHHDYYPRHHHETVIFYEPPVTQTVVEPVYIAAPIEATPGRVVSDSPYCREYQRQVVVGGHVQESYGTACRQPDGAWKIVSE